MIQPNLIESVRVQIIDFSVNCLISHLFQYKIFEQVLVSPPPEISKLKITGIIVCLNTGRDYIWIQEDLWCTHKQ